jgi:hypothetical protein
MEKEKLFPTFLLTATVMLRVIFIMKGSSVIMDEDI